MIDDYEWRVMKLRFKELQEEVAALRRALDALRAMVESWQCRAR